MIKRISLCFHYFSFHFLSSLSFISDLYRAWIPTNVKRYEWNYKNEHCEISSLRFWNYLWMSVHILLFHWRCFVFILFCRGIVHSLFYLFILYLHLSMNALLFHSFIFIYQSTYSYSSIHSVSFINIPILIHQFIQFHSSLYSFSHCFFLHLFIFIYSFISLPLSSFPPSPIH